MKNVREIRPPSAYRKAFFFVFLLALFLWLLEMYFSADFSSNEKNVPNLRPNSAGKYTIFCKKDAYTTVYFPHDEHIESYIVLDDQRWDMQKLHKPLFLGSDLQVQTIKTRTRLAILPAKTHGSASLLVKTNRSIYTITCIIDEKKYMKRVHVYNDPK